MLRAPIMEPPVTQKSDDAAADLLIKEVDEELRQDQMLQLWKRHGTSILGGFVAVILVVAGLTAWNAWGDRKREQSSLSFTEAARAAEQGKLEQAAELFGRLSTEGASGYRLLSVLKLADIKQRQGALPEAITLYDRVAVDPGANGEIQSFALLKAAYLKVDTAEPEGLERQVSPLAIESSPWRYSAREVLALLALKRGDKAKAIEFFQKIATDESAPPSTRERASNMTSALGG